MVKVTHVVTFASPASRVFAALTDFEHAYRWQTSEVLKEWKETDQPLGIGSNIYQRRLFMGKPIESMNTVTEFEQDQTLILQNPNTRVEYLITSLDPNTSQLHFTLEIQLQGKQKLFAPLARRGIQKDVVARFHNLKRYLETGATLRNTW